MTLYGEIEDVCRGLFHCRIERGGGETLCKNPDGPSKMPRAFVASDERIGHWWTDGTFWQKCELCLNHPDLPFLVLDDLDEER